MNPVVKSCVSCVDLLLFRVCVCVGVVTSFRGANSRRSSRSTERSSRKNRSTDSSNFPLPMVSRSRSNRLGGGAKVGLTSAPIPGPDSSAVGSDNCQDNRLSRTDDDNRTLESTLQRTVTSTVASVGTSITATGALGSREASRMSHGRTSSHTSRCQTRTPPDTSREASKSRHASQHSSMEGSRPPPPRRGRRQSRQHAVATAQQPSNTQHLTPSPNTSSPRHVPRGGSSRQGSLRPHSQSSEPSRRSRAGPVLQTLAQPSSSSKHPEQGSSGGGSSHGSLFYRGRQWLRRKSDKSSTRAGQAFGEGVSTELPTLAQCPRAVCYASDYGTICCDCLLYTSPSPRD